MKRIATALALAALAAGAAPAGAQIPGLGDAARVLDRVPSLSSFLEGDPPITTSLDDARTEIAFLDGWSPAGWQRLDALPRTGAGAFRLRPGRYAMEAQSYCMHAGTHGPGGGDGYLYAPLKGAKADVVQSLLRNSVAHPEIPQRDIQVLIWAIIARTEFDEMPSEMQRTARALLTRDQVDELDDGALGEVPESVMREAMNRLPPVAQQVFRAEAQLRSMISSGTSNFAALERVAVLTGAVEPPEGSRPVPGGRWSFDPAGYFVRYDPSGYSQTRVELSVPEPVGIARDGSGRIVGLRDSRGRRIEVDAAGVRYAGPGGAETRLAAAPPAAGPAGGAAEILARLTGRDGAPPEALQDLAAIEALRAAAAAGAPAAPGGAVREDAARSDALDLLAVAWQAAFCQAAGCPTMPAASDVLVLRGGAAVRGDLRWCASGTCWLGTVPYGQREIEWIGLAAPTGPPVAVNPVGEVHERDGAVEVGDLVWVSPSRVQTDAAGYDRDEVAWIHLAGMEEEEPPPAGGGGVPPPAGEPPAPGDEEDDEEGDGGDEDADGPLYDPSDDVATPGNRARQRLAPSGRPQDEEECRTLPGTTEFPPRPDCPDCQEERQAYEEAYRAYYGCQEAARARTGDSTACDDSPEGQRLIDAIHEAEERLYECARGNGWAGSDEEGCQTLSGTTEFPPRPSCPECAGERHAYEQAYAAYYRCQAQASEAGDSTACDDSPEGQRLIEAIHEAEARLHECARGNGWAGATS